MVLLELGDFGAAFFVLGLSGFGVISIIGSGLAAITAGSFLTDFGDAETGWAGTSIIPPVCW